MNKNKDTPAHDLGAATLSRNLLGRHVQLIAIGGTIGVGLFLGSARAIQSAGPGLLLSYFVFTWVTSVALVGTLWTWIIIMIAHRNYRRQVQAGRVHAVSYRMPGAPVANWLVVAFLVVVAGMLSLTPGTRVALYVAPLWFGLLGIGYLRLRYTRAHQPE